MAGILHPAKDESSKSIVEMKKQIWLMQLKRARLLASVRNRLSDQNHAPCLGAASQSCESSDAKRFPSSNLRVYPQSRIHKPSYVSLQFCRNMQQKPKLINPPIVQRQYSNHGRVPIRPVYIVMNYLHYCAAADRRGVGNDLQRHDEQRNEFHTIEDMKSEAGVVNVAPEFKKEEPENSDVDLTLKL